MDFLIKNASVVNEGEVFRADVLVENGLIGEIVRLDGAAAEAFSPGCVLNGATVIDADGKYLIPGIIDEHVLSLIHI